MRLTAAAVPTWAVKRITEQMKNAGIPIGPTSIVMYAIGRAVGIPDDELSKFTVPQRGRRPDDFLRDLEDA
jgi:hypothetical protein